MTLSGAQAHIVEHAWQPGFVLAKWIEMIGAKGSQDRVSRNESEPNQTHRSTYCKHSKLKMEIRSSPQIVGSGWIHMLHAGHKAASGPTWSIMPLNLRGNQLSFETCLDFLSTTWTSFFGHALYHPQEVHSLLYKTYVEFWSSAFESRATEFQTPRCRRVCPCKGYSKYKPRFFWVGPSSYIMNIHESCVDQITATSSRCSFKCLTHQLCPPGSPSSRPWYWCHSRCQNRLGSCACLDIKQPS